MSGLQLPPTQNRLDDDQRLRLLRSTRKLEALLGTTPFLLDAPASPHLARSKSLLRRKKSTGHLDARHPSGTTSLDEDREFMIPHSRSANPSPKDFAHFEMGTPTGKGKSPPMLRLNLPNGPSRAQSHNRTASTPTKQDFHFTPDLGAERRRKMAKLARTLGENIPPELVFHVLPSSPSLHSLASASTTSLLPHNSNPTPPPHRRKMNTALPPMTHSAPPPPSTLPMQSPPIADRGARVQRRRSSSVVYPTALLRTIRDKKSPEQVDDEAKPLPTASLPARSSSFRVRRPPSTMPFIDLSGPAAPNLLIKDKWESEREEEEARVWVLPKAPEVVPAATYEGEWNLGNMQEVQQKLRALKG